MSLWVYGFQSHRPVFIREIRDNIFRGLPQLFAIVGSNNDNFPEERQGEQDGQLAGNILPEGKAMALSTIFPYQYPHDFWIVYAYQYHPV